MRVKLRVKLEMKPIQLFFLILLFSACGAEPDMPYGRDYIEMMVSNQSDYDLDSVWVYCDRHKYRTQPFNLNSGKSKSVQLDMRGLPAADGSYRIEFNRRNSSTKESTSFGYYTNGSPTENAIDIVLETDTVLLRYR